MSTPMIYKVTSNSELKKLIISTGNMLNVYNKPGQKPNEELEHGLKLSLECYENENHVFNVNKTQGEVLRATQELNKKLTENERSAISIGAKLFINKNSKDCIPNAVNALLRVLKVEYIDNLVLAYHPQPTLNSSTPSTPVGSLTGGSPLKTENFNTIQWHSRSDENVEELKQIWTALEECALQQQVQQLGISDLDIDTLSELYASARVAPAIAQVNINKCCRVPQALQEFCNEHDIQLLTHSDPEQLLSEQESLVPGFSADWTLRYHVHVRCRGVLAAKGYILGATRVPPNHLA